MNSKKYYDFEKEISNVFIKICLNSELTAEEAKIEKAICETKSFLSLYDKIEGTSMLAIFTDLFLITPNRKSSMTKVAMNVGYSIRSLRRLKNKLIQIFKLIYASYN